jgi:hypothetical protein
MVTGTVEYMSFISHLGISETQSSDQGLNMDSDISWLRCSSLGALRCWFFTPLGARSLSASKAITLLLVGLC